MSSVELINVDAILTPISESAPSGVSVRYDPIYDKIKKAREQRNKSSFEGEEVVADWDFVIEQTIDLLSTRSKDLMLAAYLCEALVYRDGFPGFQAGISVLAGLIENFWESIHPLPDGDDIEPRIAPLAWLTTADRGSRLPTALPEIALMPADDDGPPLSWTCWKSRTVSKGESEDPTAFEARKAEAAANEERFEKRVAALKRPHFQSLVQDIERCQSELARLDAALDATAGREAPSLSPFRQRLDDCLVLAKRMLNDKGGPVEESVSDNSGSSAEHDGGDSAAPSRANMSHGLALGPITSREDAFRRLTEIAQYLRHTEPQSPVPYLVERAVNWGRLPFEKLLLELVKDAAQRNQVAELLGINWDGSSDSSYSSEES